MNYKIIFSCLLTLVLLSSCEDRYDKCMEHYVDEKGYSYEEACDQCDAEEDAYFESQARR